jgi:hypothetical protein
VNFIFKYYRWHEKDRSKERNERIGRASGRHKNGHQEHAMYSRQRWGGMNMKGNK